MDMLPPDDYEPFIRNEYEFLAGKGSIEALELFIRRFGNHPLATEARKKIEVLQNRAQHSGGC